MKKLINTLKKTLKGFPQIKSHLDALVALLTILLTITVLVQNWRNLHSTPQNIPSSKSANNTTGRTIIVQATATPPQNKTITSAPTLPSESCQKGIGPISIDSPQEGQNVSSNPICISISYQQGDYCSVVWSYSINSNSYSNYANDEPCFYNLPSGKVTFNLKVKSLVSSDTTTLERDFNYSSSSATTQ